MTKIMIVEDDASLREIYDIRIAAEGYEVISAGDGEEALAMAVREKPDLILSDVMMPKISGFDMLDILRSTPETAGIKIIIMTALSGDDQRARGERLGADRYLVKSQVSIEDVVNVIHEVLGDRVAAPKPTPEPVSNPIPTSAPAPGMPTPPVSPMSSTVPGISTPSMPSAASGMPTSPAPEVSASPMSSTPQPPQM